MNYNSYRPVNERRGGSFGAAPPSPESNEGELRKQGANNPGADTNPPEDQEDAVERVEVA